MNLICHQCGTLVALQRTSIPNYACFCPYNCLPPIDTGVKTGELFDEFDGAEQGKVEFNAALFWPPLTRKRMVTAKLFMPHIPLHFISCNRAACYNWLFLNVLVPHLDSVPVVDYVLRSSLVRTSEDAKIGKTGARIYPELEHLENFQDPANR